MNFLKSSMLSLRVLTLALAAAAIFGPPASAATVYNNTSIDTFVTYFYSPSGTEQIGDIVTLGGTERLLTAVSVQFFNSSATSGSFDATLRFYDSAVGGPVGAQIGSSYASTANAINGQDIRTVAFTNLGLEVPSTFAFTVQVLNAGSLNLGLNAFDPPTVGSSVNTSLVTGTAGSLTVASTGAGLGNLYFQASAVAVPEPSALWLGSMGALTALHHARRRNRCRPSPSLSGAESPAGVR